MKRLADNTPVPSRVYYYLLDFNEKTGWEYLVNTIKKERLADVNQSEFWDLFAYATKTDLGYYKDRKDLYCFNCASSDMITEDMVCMRCGTPIKKVDK